MTVGPCCAKSSCRARMNFSLSLFCGCRSAGPLGCRIGRAATAEPMVCDGPWPFTCVPICGTLVQIAERSVNVNGLGSVSHSYVGAGTWGAVLVKDQNGGYSS